MQFIHESHRQICFRCLRPSHHCFCHLIETIHTNIKFIILIHPLERRRKIATGRMAHLCLANSELIVGTDFTHNTQVNQILASKKYHPMILYPGENALNLSETNPSHKMQELFPSGKTPVIFVIDGTWSTASKTMKTSTNLQQLPTICFTPTTPSQFRVRKQPSQFCYSTIEAIHQVLSLIEGEEHDSLLKVFLNMVEVQVGYMEKNAATSSCAANFQYAPRA